MKTSHVFVGAVVLGFIVLYYIYEKQGWIDAAHTVQWKQSCGFWSWLTRGCNFIGAVGVNPLVGGFLTKPE